MDHRWMYIFRSGRIGKAPVVFVESQQWFSSYAAAVQDAKSYQQSQTDAGGTGWSHLQLCIETRPAAIRRAPPPDSAIPDDGDSVFSMFIYYIKERLELSGYQWDSCPNTITAKVDDKILRNIRHLAIGIERQYDLRYGPIWFDLPNPSDGAGTLRSDFWALANECFDNRISEGRVICLFTMVGSLAVQCARQQRMDLVHNLAIWGTQFVHSELHVWIEAHGGWESFRLLQAPELSRRISNDAASSSAAWQQPFNLKFFFGSTAAALYIMCIGGFIIHVWKDIFQQ